MWVECYRSQPTAGASITNSSSGELSGISPKALAHSCIHWSLGHAKLLPHHSTHDWSLSPQIWPPLPQLQVGLLEPERQNDRNLVPCNASDAPGAHHCCPSCFQAAAATSAPPRCLLLPCSPVTRLCRLTCRDDILYWISPINWHEIHQNTSALPSHLIHEGHSINPQTLLPQWRKWLKTVKLCNTTRDVADTKALSH